MPRVAHYVDSYENTCLGSPSTLFSKSKSVGTCITNRRVNVGENVERSVEFIRHGYLKREMQELCRRPMQDMNTACRLSMHAMPCLLHVVVTLFISKIPSYITSRILLECP